MTLYRNRLDEVLEKDFKPIAKFVRKHKLDKLAVQVIKNGIEPYQERIYGNEFTQLERAFFFLYTISKAITMGKYTFAAELHKNFVQELVKVKNIKIVRNPILASADPNVGSFSYATEVTIQELKNQIDLCDDPEYKEELRKLLVELIELFESNKISLYANWDRDRYIEQSLDKLNYIKEINIFICKIAVVVILAWIVARYI